jgi:hypothetical protein
MMMAVRYRGQSQPRPIANATWNIIKADDDDADYHTSSSALSSRTSTSTNTIQNSILKPKGLSVTKKNFNPSFKSMSSLSTTSSAKKYSYRLRRILQKDLQMAIDISTASPTTTTTQETKTRSTQETNHTNHSLYDEYSKDIEVLLNSLQSTEFVGTIDPQYHSRYVSDECLNTNSNTI